MVIVLASAAAHYRAMIGKLFGACSAALMLGGCGRIAADPALDAQIRSNVPAIIYFERKYGDPVRLDAVKGRRAARYQVAGYLAECGTAVRHYEPRRVLVIEGVPFDEPTVGTDWFGYFWARAGC